MGGICVQCIRVSCVLAACRAGVIVRWCRSMPVSSVFGALVSAAVAAARTMVKAQIA